ncbi:hypothetical protein A3762_00635 [Oleiphilus sp. HI0125]|uniref:type II secretion system protein N n=1 Tax=Oleiphilus sp. HI0125 TaxID=1822266 RepID=UPI0007C31B2A|nr:type II secretion system protein N [Oleiphilus sp. HI0125]KZZ59520.1 hypothetical protein A3762_00635 [Oleiphilus sp. HI0125]
MIKKTFLVLLLFVVALPFFLLSSLPASVLWTKVIEPAVKTKSLGIMPKSFAGTAWDGEAYVSFRHLEGVFSWKLSVLDVFGGSIPLQVDVRSTAGDASAILDIGLRDQSLSIETLRLDTEKLNPFLRIHRVKATGEVYVKDLSVRLEKRRVASIDGRFTWAGGEVSYPAGRDIRDRVMPAFGGQIQTQESGDIVLGIRDQEASFDTMRVTWSANGDALWEVTRRVLDVAQEPWAANSTEQDVVFKVKKPVSRQLGKQ